MVLFKSKRDSSPVIAFAFGLQHVQNTADRLVARTKKSGHITPVLMPLHWLPINARIDFKILLLILNNQAPDYIKELLSGTLFKARRTREERAEQNASRGR